MKKWYILASCLLVSGAMMAQSNASFQNEDASPRKDNSSIVSMKGNPNPAETNKDGVDAIFTEDFANGLAGNNELNEAWTTGGANGALWLQNFDGPEGQYSTNTGALESATAANGFMLIDCDLYNTPSQIGDVQGWMISPAIDMSILNSVLVDYTTYFRYCCSNDPDLFPALIGVSVDDGVNWTDFRMFGYNQFIMGANNQSGTIDVTTDISEVAAGESAVLIRFAYNPGNNNPMSHYYLGVDDIEVYENPNANNLAVLQVTNNNVQEVWEIKNYPLEQSPNILAGVVYGNYGSSAQTNVVITFEIIDANDVVLNTTTEVIGDMATNIIDTVYHQTNYALADLGDYRVRATITSTEVEEVPENTIMDREITVTEVSMSYDDLANLDTQNGPRENDAGDGFEEGGYANYFFVEAEGSSAHGIEVVFGDNSTVGSEVFIQFFDVTGADINEDADNMPIDELTLAEYYITEADLDENSVYIPFDSDVTLEIDKAYFVTVRVLASENEMWVRATFNTDTDNSSYERDFNSDQEPTWFSSTDENAVRLALNMSLSVADLAATKASFTISPNPVSSTTVVNYTLDAQATVSYSIFDVNGRLIEQVKLGNQEVGSQAISLDASNLDAGIYYFNLYVGDASITEKLIVTK